MRCQLPPCPVDDGIEQLQDLTQLLLNIGPTFDPYRDSGSPSGALCANEPKGQLGSRILSLTYYVWRSLRYPDSYGPAGMPGPYQIPDEIQCLLPPFPGESLPAACIDPAFGRPPYTP